VLLLADCGKEVALPSLPPDAVILAFGDSLTEGTGAGSEENYPAVLEALTGRRVVNAGKRGEESDAGLARLPGVMARVKPDLVILEHGGNDILRGRDLKRTEENLKQMVLLVQGEGASVVLLGIPSRGYFLGTHHCTSISQSPLMFRLKDMPSLKSWVRGISSRISSVPILQVTVSWQRQSSVCWWNVRH
jgi:acyl-CoA thioesterase-1